MFVIELVPNGHTKLRFQRDQWKFVMEPSNGVNDHASPRQVTFLNGGILSSCEMHLSASLKLCNNAKATFRAPACPSSMFDVTCA